MCLIEPESAERIEGIGIEIGELRALLPHALRPLLRVLRGHERLHLDDDRTQLGLTLGWTSTDRSYRPGYAVHLRKGIVRDDLTYSLIVCRAQYGEMLVSKQGEL
jgi:hypothetical protein